MTEKLECARRWYGNDLRVRFGIESGVVIDAFARVPRERFLGPPPWRILSPRIPPEPGRLEYRTLPDDDPALLYHDVLVAIDESRGLNNGQPSFWAVVFEALAVRPGARVVHIGCGTGYYTALLAEQTGSAGEVLAIEVDASLAARARDGLSAWSGVTVMEGNGAEIDIGSADAIVVNAGMTHPLPQWLEALTPGGRLALPLTIEGLQSEVGFGAVLMVTRRDQAFAAHFICPTGIFHFAGARDAEENSRLAEAFRTRRAQSANIKSLRRDSHEADETCWLHSCNYCLSLREAG